MNGVRYANMKSHWMERSTTHGMLTDKPRVLTFFSVARPEVGEERGALFAVHPGRKLLEVILVAQVLILVSI